MASKEEPAKRAIAYRRRAEEIATLADAMKDRICRIAMLRIAASYETMARTAEHMAGKLPDIGEPRAPAP